MKDFPEINDDDSELFRRTVGEVRPVRLDTVPSFRRRPRPVPAQRHADERAVVGALASGELDPADVETGEEIQFQRPGIQDRVFQKLRRGQFTVDAELDLHGMTISAAKQALSRFLLDVRRRQRSCVRIIHGKGRGSKNGKPVLKVKLQGWLQQRDEVLAYCSALPRDGGTGAVYVLVKRRNGS
jgi:DNA-nicking Smr family endonuclease